MQRMAWGVMIAVASLGSTALGEAVKPARADAKADAEPTHRVAAIYFHRTNRCATCKKISAYIEEAVQAEFAKEFKGGQVSVSMIDFQDKKNKEFTEGYKITGPTLGVGRRPPGQGEGMESLRPRSGR